MPKPADTGVVLKEVCVSQPLPTSLDLSFDKKQAKALLKACRDGDAAALARMHRHLSRSRQARAKALTLADTQFVVAREHGFESWAKLKAHVDAQRSIGGHTERFLATVREQQLKVARRILREHSAIVAHSVHAAAAAGAADRVAACIARDPAQASAVDRDSQWTPILYACWSTFHTVGPQPAADSLRVIQLLLDHGADPNAYTISEHDSESRLPALYRACVSNNVAAVRLLLDRGASVNDGESVYHGAELNHRECLALLLEHGENISHRHPRWDNTPLYYLVGHHDDEHGAAPWFLGVKWLLERGADPNVTSYANKEAPLHKVAATPTQSLDVAKAFVAHGADVDLARADGRTPYVLAVRRGNAAVADLLRARGAATDGLTPVDALLGACMRADAAEAQALIARDTSVIARLSPEDRWVFSQAVWAGRADSIRLMARLGFDLTWEGEWRGTPLHLAAWLGKPELVRLLLDLGAPVNVRDSEYGSSPIAWAAHGSANCRSADADYRAVVDRLIDAGSEYASSINKHNEAPEPMASRRVAKRMKERGFGARE